MDKRRMVVGALVALLALSNCIQVLAVETLSLSELKQQTPERLVMDVQTQTGDRIHVEAPITLPEGNTLPILQAGRVTFHAADLLDQYPLENGATKAEQEAASYWNYDGTPILGFTCTPQSIRKSATGECSRISLHAGEQPPLNDMPATRPLELIHEIVMRFSDYKDLDIRTKYLIAKSGLYGYGKMQVGAMTKISMPDPTKPIKGYEKGLWELHVAQYIRGAEIFGGRYNPYPGYEQQTQEIWPELVQYAYLEVMDEDDFSLSVSLLKVSAVLLEDVPLAPFSIIKEAVEKRIADGQLHSVYKVSLGYTICMRKGDSLRTSGLANTDMVLLLVPVWQVKGYDLKDMGSREWVGFAEPTAEEVMGDIHNTYELRLDARSGELLLDYHTDL